MNDHPYRANDSSDNFTISSLPPGKFFAALAREHRGVPPQWARTRIATEVRGQPIDFKAFELVSL